MQGLFSDIQPLAQRFLLLLFCFFSLSQMNGEEKQKAETRHK